MTTMTADVERTVRETVARELKPFHLDSVNVTEGIDHDGEPALYVTARLSEGSDVSPDTSLSTRVALIKALHAMGETRFPYLKIRVDQDEPEEDAEP